MLVLHRRRNESIKIGNDIEVVVVELGNGYVKLGITAPTDVLIARTEMIPKMKFDLKARRQRLGETDDVANS